MKSWLDELKNGWTSKCHARKRVKKLGNLGFSSASNWHIMLNKFFFFAAHCLCIMWDYLKRLCQLSSSLIFVMPSGGDYQRWFRGLSLDSPLPSSEPVGSLEWHGRRVSYGGRQHNIVWKTWAVNRLNRHKFHSQFCYSSYTGLRK